MNIFKASLIVVAMLCQLPMAYASSINQFVEPRELQDFRWLDGKESIHNLRTYEGKPLILHFWAAWCIPCREELPDLLEWRKSNSDIEVIIVSLDQRQAQTRHFITRFELDMPPLILHQDDKALVDVPVVPFTLFVGKDGKAIADLKGIAEWNDSSFSSNVHQLF